MTTCLWHYCQKREKLHKLIITKQSRGRSSMKEGEVTEVTSKREKAQEGTSEDIKREIFLFGIVLLF